MAKALIMARSRFQPIRFILFCILFLCIKHVEARKLPGFFISNKADTIRVTFDVPYYAPGIPDLHAVQYKIKYRATDGKKLTLKPTQARELYFVADKDTVHMISKKVPDFLWQYFDDSLFLRIRIKGRLSLYSFYPEGRHDVGLVATMKYPNKDGALMVRTEYERAGIVLERDNQLFIPRRLHFKKDMKDFLSDCPALAAKIEPEHSPSLPYSPEDIETIVMEYNSGCKAKD